MRSILYFLRNYFATLNRSILWITTAATALLIVTNYTIGIEPVFRKMPPALKFTGFFLLYAFIFTGVYFITFLLQKRPVPTDLFFYVLLLAAPVLFAMKISFDQPARWLSSHFSRPWDHYAFLVINWPLKCAVMLLLITGLWQAGRYPPPVAGMGGSNFPFRPYLWLLLCMIPLLALAATLPDFLRAYPKVHIIGDIASHTSHGAWWKLLFELAYGSDFMSIEIFFRGLLVLGFMRYAGQDAILPMAAFYCTIHFGKPLGECISSYFGGIILGVVVYNTGSIWGGLTVHLGIAWLMEVAGWLGHLRLGK